MPVGSGQKVHVSWEKVATARRTFLGPWAWAVSGAGLQAATVRQAASARPRAVWLDFMMAILLVRRGRRRGTL